MEQGLAWSSLQWKDGTRYEGLTRNGKMHSHGVLMFSNKDRYEGEFEDGKMHGAGVYVWSSGMIHRGDWLQGMMHGCGTRIWQDPDGGLQAAEGRFAADEFVGDVMPCSRDDGSDAAVEADMAAYQARSFLIHGRQQQRAGSRPGIMGSRQQQQQHQQHPQAAGMQGGSTSAGSGSNAAGAASLDPRLQGVLQRLVADKVAETKRQQPGRVS